MYGDAVGARFDAETSIRVYLEAPAYHLHYWTPDKNLITHAVVVKPVDGPYLFEEQDVIHSQQPYTLFYP